MFDLTEGVVLLLYCDYRKSHFLLQNCPKEDILQAKGFRISSVETGRSSDRPKTAVMTANSHVNLFYGMPFPCVIMPVEGAGEQQAIVYIGRDYQSTPKHKDGET